VGLASLTVRNSQPVGFLSFRFASSSVLQFRLKYIQQSVTGLPRSAGKRPNSSNSSHLPPRNETDDQLRCFGVNSKDVGSFADCDLYSDNEPTQKPKTLEISPSTTGNQVRSLSSRYCHGSFMKPYTKPQCLDPRMRNPKPPCRPCSAHPALPLSLTCFKQQNEKPRIT
jgi:hypothetical protein